MLNALSSLSDDAITLYLILAVLSLFGFALEKRRAKQRKSRRYGGIKNSSKDDDVIV